MMASDTELDLDEVFKDGQDLLNEIPVQEKLASLSKHAHEQLELEQEIARLEAQLDDKNKALRTLSDVTIPDLMDELRIDEFRLSNGVRVTVNPYYSGKITGPECLKWLEDNGEADIIKGEVNIPFPKGFSKEKLRLIVKIAQEVGLPADVGETVHASTLKAWIKHMVQNGKQFPRELFNAYVGKRTKLTLK